MPLVQVIVEEPDKVNPSLQVTSYFPPESIVPDSGVTLPSFIVGLVHRDAETNLWRTKFDYWNWGLIRVSVVNLIFLKHFLTFEYVFSDKSSALMYTNFFGKMWRN